MDPQQKNLDVSKVKTIRATVAKGRTVVSGSPTERKIAGYHPDTGKAIMVPILVEYGEFTEVDLPEPEVRRLRALGYLIDPDRAPIPVASNSANVRQAA